MKATVLLLYLLYDCVKFLYKVGVKTDKKSRELLPIVDDIFSIA